MAGGGTFGKTCGGAAANAVVSLRQRSGEPRSIASAEEREAAFRQTHTHSSTSSKATAKAILKKYGSRVILAAFFYCINVTDSEPLEIRKNNASCWHVSNAFSYFKGTRIELPPHI